MDFLRVLPAVQNAIHNHFMFRLHPIIDRVRKPFGQQAVKSKNPSMNPGVKHQGINIRKEGVQKITTQAFTLLFIETPSTREVIESRGEQPDFHRPARNFSLACSQSSSVSSP